MSGSKLARKLIFPAFFFLKKSILFTKNEANFSFSFAPLYSCTKNFKRFFILKSFLLFDAFCSKKRGKLLQGIDEFGFSTFSLYFYSLILC